MQGIIDLADRIERELIELADEVSSRRASTTDI